MTHFLDRLIVPATAAASCMAIAIGASADLLAYEGFSYGASANIQGANGGTGWGSAWGKLSSIPTGATTDGLTWPGLPTSGGSAFTAAYASADYTRYSRVISAFSAPDDRVYLSFLFRPNPGFGVGGGLAFGTWENGMIVGIATDTGHYGLAGFQGPSVPTSTPLVQGATSLLVARIDKNADGTITWSLHVNPQIDAGEPAVAGASMTIPGTMLPPALFIFNDGGFSTDEIRFGTTWESVLMQPPAPCATDFDANGVVDGSDLAVILGFWGACAGCPADLNDDGIVDGVDLALVLGQWGACN